MKVPPAFLSTDTSPTGDTRLSSCPIMDPGSAPSSPVSSVKLLGSQKLSSSSNQPKTNGGVERVNRTLAQMLSMLVDER